MAKLRSTCICGLTSSCLVVLIHFAPTVFLFYVYLFIYIVIYLSFYASMAIYLFIFIFIIVPDNYFFLFVSKSFIIFAHLQGTVTFHDWHCLLVGTVNYLEVPTFCVVFH